MFNLINKIGDGNPQLFRELKGRLKPFPVIIALVTSIATQLIIFLYQFREFPGEKYNFYSKYCKLNNTRELYSQYKFCPVDQIDMEMWWQDHWEYMFLTLSIIFIFTLLVAGTYLLVNDLSQEERRGTLNFIRLSPQSERTIFTGKLLGVPILIYLSVLTAIPFHILTGKFANIAFSYIALFYLVLISSCIFFYSIALLFGIFGGSALGGFKPWLGSGLVFLFLVMTISMNESRYYDNNIAFFQIFSPIPITDYLFPNLFNHRTALLNKLQFFGFDSGKNIVSLLAVHLLNYTVWTYWIWQGLKRCFRNQNATIFSKQQSYLIVASIEVMLLGFILSGYWNGHSFDKMRRLYSFDDSIKALYLWNICIFIGLFAILLPHRQSIQDWARFRYQKATKNKASFKHSLLSDLISSEKSPGILAIAINSLIAASAFIILVTNAKVGIFEDEFPILGFLGILLFISSTMIYATIAQIMLMLKNSKRHLWAMGATGAVIILPIVVLSILTIPASRSDLIGTTLWLFTSGFWYGVINSNPINIFIAFVCQLAILALLNWYLFKQVKSAGESATKALFASSKS